MQIDSVSKIINGMTVPEFRTLCVEYLKLLGYSEANLTDGPYDGVKDFKLLYDSNKSISIAMSTTSKWQKKLIDDIDNMKKKNSDITNVYYLSSQRMPESTFQTIQQEISLTKKVFVIKYDAQTIASDFVKKNHVGVLLQIAGIDIDLIMKNSKDYGNRKLLNKNIAVSSLLLFSNDANELRKSFFETIIETQINNSSQALTRETLIDKIIDEYSFNNEQAPYVNSQFDRLLQAKKIYVKDSKYYINSKESTKLNGLETQFNLEFSEIKELIINKFKNTNLSFSPSEMSELVENIEDFILGLTRNSLGLREQEVDEKGMYIYIRTLIEDKYTSQQNGVLFLDELLSDVAKSPFAKRISCTEMTINLFNLDSDDLLNIFKAKISLSIYLDTSVAIPLLCSLLWGEFSSRYSYSAKTLYELLNIHNFKMSVMNKYLEEIASHLIHAAQIHKIVDKINEPLIFPNAFITHYTRIHKDNNISFSDYLNVFEINLMDIPAQDDDISEFIKTRKKIEYSIRTILSSYDIDIIDCKAQGYLGEIKNLENIRNTKKDLLLEHDACVIKYLSTNVNNERSNVLCTWDKALVEYKTTYSVPFSVLSPIALIDLTSMAKGSKSNNALASYINFAKLQDEQMLEVASSIWNVLMKIEKNELLDAQLLLKAKEFHTDYMDKHQKIDDLDNSKISEAWLAWKDK